MQPAPPDWIAVDWGTSTLRAWAMTGRGEVLHQARSDDGMASIVAGGGDFESALLDLISAWLDTASNTPLVACGMVGAKQGWQETPYHTTPCPPQSALVRVRSRSGTIIPYILSGVSQSAPPDVMRGEETQIAGLLAASPGFEGTACLPGTHSKWVTIKDGQIDSFRTFQSGELFELLATRSVLAQTVASDGFERAEFLTGYHATLARPGQFLAQTFSLRASALLDDLGPIAARSRLSGYLVGLELAGATPSGPVALIGAPHLTELYQIALQSSGVGTTTHDPDQTTLDGLRAAYATLLS